MDSINHMHDKKKPHLKKLEWEALGRLLLPEAIGKSTLEAKTAKKLVALGLIERYYEALPPHPSDPPWVQARMRMTITGYRMTQRGQLLYCQWADKQVTEDRIEQNEATPRSPAPRSDPEGKPSGRAGS